MLSEISLKVPNIFKVSERLSRPNIFIVHNRSDAFAGEENQVTGFLGEGLPKNAQLWSKAGWTSKVRHDAAYIEVPNKQPYLLTVFTEGQENASNPQILPFISQAIANISFVDD